MKPAPIKERTEYLSPQWIEHVRQFLTDNTPSVNISLCEAYDSPPDGINGSFWIRVENGNVEVGEGVVEDVDLLIKGQYIAALELAPIPFAAGQEAMARATRETTHRWGESALRIVKGSPADLPPEILALHDYMAARTILPLDIQYRLQKMGLAQNVKELQEQGYTIMENIITEAFADELREVTQRHVLAHSDLTTNGLATQHRLFEELLQHPYMNTVCHAILGQTMINGALAGSYKTAGPGAIPPHTDALFLDEPYPEWPVAAVTCWALEEWTESAGPTWVIPGSHKRRRMLRKEDSLDGAVPIIMPKGSAAIWVDGVWHWQGERSDPGARVALHVTNNRVFARQLDNIEVSDEILARNPPAFFDLIGPRRPFGKSGHGGHNLDYMMHTGTLHQKHLKHASTD